MNILTDTTKQDKQNKKSESKRDRELSDIRFLLKFPEFRRFYWRLLDEGAVFGNLFCGEQVQTASYLLGKRDVGLEFFKDLNDAKYDAFQQIRQEHLSEKTSEQIIEDIEDKKLGGLF